MNTLVHWRTVGLALALLCAALSSSSLAAGELHIRGRVLNEKGEPVKGTLVVAVCTGALPEGPHIDCGFPGMMGRKTTTGGDGEFSLERLPLAVYSVYTAIEAKDNGGTAAEVALRVELRQSQDGLELRAPRAPPLGSISGLVVDTSGSPVADAHVQARMKKVDWPPGATERNTQGSVRTDTQGRFELQGLAAGPYALEVRQEGYEKFVSSEEVRPGTPVTVRLVPTRVKVAQGQAEVQVVLEAGLGLSGKALDGT